MGGLGARTGSGAEQETVAGAGASTEAGEARLVEDPVAREGSAESREETGGPGAEADSAAGGLATSVRIARLAWEGDTIK